MSAKCALDNSEVVVLLEDIYNDHIEYDIFLILYKYDSQT